MADNEINKISFGIVHISVARVLRTCLKDWSEQLLELSGVPMLAAAADGVVTNHNLPWSLRLDEGIVQILTKVSIIGLKYIQIIVYIGL